MAAWTTHAGARQILAARVAELLITYQEEEESNEHVCMAAADNWVRKWRSRLEGILGADLRASG